MDFEDIPNEWFCPITQELMKDPVIGSDGFSYERKAITEWLTKSAVSPVTREIMEHKNLIPNLALRHTITQYLENHEIKGPVKKNSENKSEVKPIKNKKKGI